MKFVPALSRVDNTPSDMYHNNKDAYETYWRRHMRYAITGDGSVITCNDRTLLRRQFGLIVRHDQKYKIKFVCMCTNIITTTITPVSGADMRIGAYYNSAGGKCIVDASMPRPTPAKWRVCATFWWRRRHF